MNTPDNQDVGNGQIDPAYLAKAEAWLAKPPSPTMVEGCAAFMRELPELLAHRQNHPQEKWVAYHGNQRLRFGKTQLELVKDYLGQVLKREDLLVVGIDAAFLDPRSFSID